VNLRPRGKKKKKARGRVKREIRDAMGERGLSLILQEKP